MGLSLPTPLALTLLCPENRWEGVFAGQKEKSLPLAENNTLLERPARTQEQPTLTCRLLLV